MCLWLDERSDQLKLPVRVMSGHDGHPDHIIQMVNGQASHRLFLKINNTASFKKQLYNLAYPP